MHTKDEQVRLPASDVALAAPIAGEIPLNACEPADEWSRATSIRFSQDWQGRNDDPGRQTEVRLLWTRDTLYVRFDCRYRELYLFEDSDRSGRRDHLWDRDVAEIFLQPDPSQSRYYREFEISPNGMWVDLDIFPEGRRDLESGMKHSAWFDPMQHVWTAEMAIPMRSLTADFDSGDVWRVNFYRVEGRTEPRFYSAWQATNTDMPNFHVPARFGKLCFETQPH